MSLINFDRYYRFIVWGILLIFFILKFNFLSLSLFWDEDWVYGPAVKQMVDNGAGLWPNSIDVNLSRGHPLFFHFSYGLWGMLFGATNFSFHLFSLVISLITLYSIYSIVALHTNKLFGLASMIFTACQLIFYIQSTLIFPEMMLALFGLLTIHLYNQSNKLFYLSGSILLLIKETGIVVICALILTELLIFLYNNQRNIQSIKATLFSISKISIVFIPVSIFFISQFLIHGWFFFPEHIDIVALDIKSINDKFKIIYNFFFNHQQRVWIIIAVLVIQAILIKKKWFIKGCMLLILLAIPKILFGYWNVPMTLKLPIVILLFLVYLSCLFDSRQYQFEQTSISKLLIIIWVTVLIFFLFSSVNFFSVRYTLILIPLLSIILVTSIWSINTSYKLKVILISAFVISSIISSLHYSIFTKSTPSDVDMSYVESINILTKASEFINNENIKGRINSNFVVASAFNNPSNGYLTNGNNLEFVNRDKNAEYLIVSNIGELNNIEDTLNYSILIKEFRQNKVFLSIYASSSQSVHTTSSK